MAEPAEATLPSTGASGPDGLLATKLYVPRPQPGFVLRTRLVEGLNHGLAQGLILVCAPAGFGKTALLADWARRAQRPVAWLSLDQGDNDPARFWRHVVAALGAVRPGVAEHVAPLLGPPPPSSFEGLVTASTPRSGPQELSPCHGRRLGAGPTPARCRMVHTVLARACIQPTRSP
jgi:LuxR family maltose regulon positive regulatory protein